jgi:hypothetical protein
VQAAAFVQMLRGILPGEERPSFYQRVHELRNAAKECENCH